MKSLLRPPHQGRSGYAALMIFLLVYLCTLGLVLAPDQVIAALGQGLNLR